MVKVGTVKVWITSSWLSPDDVLEKDGQGFCDQLGIGYSNHDMSKHGWVHIGEANIAYKLISRKEMVTQKLASLNAVLQKDRADTQMRHNAILEKISKLEAIGYDQ